MLQSGEDGEAQGDREFCAPFFSLRSDEGIRPTGATRAPGVGGWCQVPKLAGSGGVQEEACILGVPCVTLRDNTERPETIELRTNVLAGADGHPMMKKAKLMMQQGGGWRSPFWDRNAMWKIVQIFEN